MKTVDHSNHTMKRFGFTLLLTLLLSMLGNNAWAAYQTLKLYEGTGGTANIPNIQAGIYLKSQYIIPASDLTAANVGIIYQISNVTTHFWGQTYSDYNVYVEEVDYTTISTLEDMTGATKVYTGKLESEDNIDEAGYVKISFTTPYTYKGGNLLITFERSLGVGTSYGFYGQTVSYNAAIWGSSDTSLDDITTVTPVNFLPRTIIVYETGKTAPTYTPPTAISGLVYTGSAQTLIEAGTVSGGTMKYSLDGTTWSASLPTGTNAGTYNVYYRVDGDASHLDVPYDAAHKVTVTIAKAPPTYTAPTVKEGLVYDSNPQELITAGSTEDGTLEYSMNGSAWTTDASTIIGTNAGNYSIDYRLIGDANHLDVPSRFIIAKIERRDITKTTGYADDKYVTVTTTDQTWTGNLVNISGIYTIVLDTDPSSTPYSLTASDYDVFVTIGETPVDVKDAGRYSIVFVGQGNFDGTVTRTFDVKKDVATDIDYDIATQVLPKTGDFVPVIIVTDGASHATLVENVDYTVKYYEADADNAYAKSATEIADPASITAQGKYWVTVTGLAPKYTGSNDKAFYVVNEYQTLAATTTNPAVSFHVDADNPGFPDNSTKGQVNVGAATAPAIAATAKTVVIPATISVEVADQTIIFDVTGFENEAFNGCTSLHYIDATALEDYVPTTLERETIYGPFKGLPKQTLVFLSGTSVNGENYIYKVKTDDYRCNILKIYDDVSAVQTGFDNGTAAQWDFMNPYEFTTDYVVNTRLLNVEINSKQQGYTVCLPYALPISDSFKAYTPEASKEGLVGFTEVTGTLAAMTPYLLLPSASGELLSTENATIVKTYDATATPAFISPASLTKTSAAVSGQTQYSMTGTMAYLPGATTMYILQKNNEWKHVETAGTNWPEPCVLPMRAYLEASGAAPARLFSLFTSGIENLEVDADTRADIYDLQGRKVKNPKRGGIYIVNGRKMIKKEGGM